MVCCLVFVFRIGIVGCIVVFFFVCVVRLVVL